MKNLLKDLNIKIKNWIANTLLKKFIIPSLLFLIYFLVLGPTSLIAKIFYRNKLIRRNKSDTSNWNEVNIDELTDEELKSQS
jgi:hypothetical protein